LNYSMFSGPNASPTRFRHDHDNKSRIDNNEARKAATASGEA